MLVDIGNSTMRLVEAMRKLWQAPLEWDSELRESLTRKPLEDMRRIEEYKCLEDDRLQSKGKAQVMSCPR